jgi:dTDP-4-amino-4,6-dideoxygalactose transaminase
MGPTGTDHELGYGRQWIAPEDVEAVVRVLRGALLTQGPAVAGFEAALCAATGAPHAVAVNNGTSALQVACLALGIGPGARVATTANTFLASAVAPIHCGAEVAFVDVEPASGNMDLDSLARMLGAGPRVEAVVVVHFAGLPLDMARLLALKRAFGFKLIEDAAHALGASYVEGGRAWRVGEHPALDATTLSFHPVKHITTAEGGAVLLHDAGAARRVRRLASHGIDREAGHRPCFAGDEPEAEGDAPPRWFAPMVEPGFNLRLSDVHAALGASQLARLPAFLARRRALAAGYRAALPEVLPAATACDPGDGAREHAYHLFWVRVPRRDALMRHLARRGIGTQVHYYPVPHQPWFRARCGVPDVPRAVEHARTALSLPLYPALTDADQARVLDALAEWRP